MWRSDILAIAAVLAAVLTVADKAAAQDLRSQQARLDSLLSPTLAENHAQMHFAATTIDAGEMGEDDTPRSYTFLWRNAGKEPLVVTRVQTTCGCARAMFDREPVLAGGEGQISVEYHPKGHPGSFQRKIFVYTQQSTKYPTAVLELQGRVIPSAKPTHDYPHMMGALGVKRREIRIDPAKLTVERVECMNCGDRPLCIAADSRLLPPSLKVWCDKTSIAPAERADLIVEYDPTLTSGVQAATVPVILTGVESPPSVRTIRVIFENKE